MEINEGVSDTNNNDAKLTDSERANLRKEGAKETQDSPKKTGIKMTVAKSVDTANDGAVGRARHRDPTIFIEQQNTGGFFPKPDPKRTGETIAHELAHALTLGSGHAVTDTVAADENGHTNPNIKGSAHRGNLMAPSGRGTALTDKQIEEMTRRRHDRSRRRHREEAE